MAPDSSTLMVRCSLLLMAMYSSDIVEFRMTVFRPFRGEIVYGRIKSSNEEGIIIDLEFTSEVFIPYQNLPENSSFSQAENVWVWNSEGTELFFDKGEPVLFRVEHEEWFDQRPNIVEKDEKGEIIEERPTAWRVIVCSPGSLNMQISNHEYRVLWLSQALARHCGGQKAEKRARREMWRWRMEPKSDDCLAMTWDHVASQPDSMHVFFFIILGSADLSMQVRYEHLNLQAAHRQRMLCSGLLNCSLMFSFDLHRLCLPPCRAPTYLIDWIRKLPPEPRYLSPHPLQLNVAGGWGQLQTKRRHP
jgi:hypothetical protein